MASSDTINRASIRRRSDEEGMGEGMGEVHGEGKAEENGGGEWWGGRG